MTAIQVHRDKRKIGDLKLDIVCPSQRTGFVMVRGCAPGHHRLSDISFDGEVHLSEMRAFIKRLAESYNYSVNLLKNKENKSG